MATQKTLVKALQPFAHGNVSAQTGRVYAMNPADAQELVKAGFAEEATEGEPEQTQVALPTQQKQAGDVVVDDAADLLGDGKAVQDADTKMARTTANKSTAKK